MILGILVLLLALGLFRWNDGRRAEQAEARRQAEHAAAMSALEEDESARRARAAAEARERQWTGNAPTEEAPYYECQGLQGKYFQAQPCPPTDTTGGASSSAPSAEDLARQARLRQQEEQLRQYSQIYGGASPAGTVQRSGPSAYDQRRARCQAQKEYRDAVLARVGLNRTFDLLRKLDDQVYEACKGL